MRLQRGIGALELFLVLSIFSVCAYFLFIVPFLEREVVSQIRSTPPSVSIKYKEQVEQFKSKSKSHVVPGGVYFGEVELDGGNLSLTYDFSENGEITKEVLLFGKHKIAGSASYKFEGSTMLFENIVGDVGLFSEIGEPITILSSDVIIVYESGRPIKLKTEALSRMHKDQLAKIERVKAERIKATSFFELPPDEKLLKITGNRTAMLVIVFLILPLFLVKIFTQMKQMHGN